MFMCGKCGICEVYVICVVLLFIVSWCRASHSTIEMYQWTSALAMFCLWCTCQMLSTHPLPMFYSILRATLSTLPGWDCSTLTWTRTNWFCITLKPTVVRKYTTVVFSIIDKIQPGKLFNNGKDMRAYVFPSLLRYTGPGTERNMQFVGEDVIGVSLWETRCHKRRHDLIVYSIKNDRCYRVAHDDNKKLNGCHAFLANRHCDLEHKISDDLQMAAMRWFDLFVVLFGRCFILLTAPTLTTSRFGAGNTIHCEPFLWWPKIPSGRCGSKMNVMQK